MDKTRAGSRSRAASRERSFDILIAGGGLAGMTLACALAPLGLRIALVDAGDPARNSQDARTTDGRTTALAYAARRFYERIGVWQALAGRACPIRDIRVANGGKPGLLDFASAEIGEEPFGHIVENADLRAALAARMANMPGLEVFTHAHIRDCSAGDAVAGESAASLLLENGPLLENGMTLAGKLLVVADGRNSFCRRRLGIPVRRHDYGQSATILNIAHTRPHENLALENFYPGGPFAVLPMTDSRKGKKTVHRSSVVWSESRETARALLALPRGEFAAHLAARVGDWLGEIEILTDPASYPLSLVHAMRYRKGRALLLGDAAHGIHPIAGQGFNLTVRDIGALADLLAEIEAAGGDIGASPTLGRYEKNRRFDNLAMIAATHGLDRLFSNALPPLTRLRGLGLAVVNRLRGPRHFFMRQAMGRKA